MMGNFELPKEIQDSVAAQLIGKSWEELETLEMNGRLLFPEKLLRRRKNGELEEIPVLVQVPRLKEERKARVEARRMALKDGLDPKLDKDLIDELEVVCTLSQVIRNVKPEHERWEPFPEALEEKYDLASLQQIWAKLNALGRVIDPAPDSIGEGEMVALASAIAKERNLSPLFVYGSAAQSTFVITMADLLMSLLGSKSSSEPSGSSTPECSATTGS